jgi:DNA-binding GntR family transcriptional regulator
MMFDTSKPSISRSATAELAHNAILEAIAIGDSTAAASLMSAHLSEAWSEIEAVIDAAPDTRSDPTASR